MKREIWREAENKKFCHWKVIITKFKNLLKELNSKFEQVEEKKKMTNVEDRSIEII